MKKPPTRQQAWQERKLAKGLCTICGRKPLFSKLACRICLVARRKYDRKRQNTKAWKPGGPGKIPLEFGKKTTCNPAGQE